MNVIEFVEFLPPKHEVPCPILSTDKLGILHMSAILPLGRYKEKHQKVKFIFYYTKNMKLVYTTKDYSFR